jgi:hypothetical protein
MKKATIFTVSIFGLSFNVSADCQAQAGDGPAWCGTAWACNTVGLTGKQDTGKFAGFALGGKGVFAAAIGRSCLGYTGSLAALRDAVLLKRFGLHEGACSKSIAYSMSGRNFI